MKESTIKLFNKLKEEFESATDFGDYSCINTEFEIDDYDDDYVRVTAKVDMGGDEWTVVYLEAHTGKSEEFPDLKVSYDGDCYDQEWCSFDTSVGHLWRALLFNKTSK